MPDIHMLYRIAYEAALSAQIFNHQARLDVIQRFVLNDALQFEAKILHEQITTLKAEVERLDK